MLIAAIMLIWSQHKLLIRLDLGGIMGNQCHPPHKADHHMTSAAATLGAQDKQEWVSKHSSRIWRGTLASKKWRYIADGAWAPREPARKSRSKSQSGARGRARGTARSTGASCLLHDHELHVCPVAKCNSMAGPVRWHVA